MLRVITPVVAAAPKVLVTAACVPVLAHWRPAELDAQLMEHADHGSPCHS
jgi:hypothetical protein